MPLVRREHEDVAHGHFMRRDTEREFYVPPEDVQPGDELAEPESPVQLEDLADRHPDEYDADEGYVGEQFDEDGNVKPGQFMDGSAEEDDGTTVPDVDGLDPEEFANLNARVARAAIEMGRPTDGELQEFLVAELERSQPRTTVVRKLGEELGYSDEDIEGLLGDEQEPEEGETGDDEE